MGELGEILAPVTKSPERLHEARAEALRLLLDGHYPILDPQDGAGCCQGSAAYMGELYRRAIDESAVSDELLAGLLLQRETYINAAPTEEVHGLFRGQFLRNLVKLQVIDDGRSHKSKDAAIREALKNVRSYFVSKLHAYLGVDLASFQDSVSKVLKILKTRRVPILLAIYGSGVTVTRQNLFNLHGVDQFVAFNFDASSSKWLLDRGYAAENQEYFLIQATSPRNLGNIVKEAIAALDLNSLDIEQMTKESGRTDCMERLIDMPIRARHMQYVSCYRDRDFRPVYMPSLHRAMWGIAKSQPDLFQPDVRGHLLMSNVQQRLADNQPVRHSIDEDPSSSWPYCLRISFGRKGVTYSLSVFLSKTSDGAYAIDVKRTNFRLLQGYIPVDGRGTNIAKVRNVREFRQEMRAFYDSDFRDHKLFEWLRKPIRASGSEPPDVQSLIQHFEKEGDYPSLFNVLFSKPMRTVLHQNGYNNSIEYDSSLGWRL